MSSFALSPSRIARYFYHQCERYLRYHSTPSALRAAGNVPQIPYNGSPITEAILAGGYAWEEKVVEGLPKDRVTISQWKKPLHKQAHDKSRTIPLLRDLAKGAYLYQATLEVPTGFLESFDVPADLCVMSLCRPDLIHKIDQPGQPGRFRVVDVKSGSALKASHQIQVGLYTLMLDAIVKNQAPDLEVDLEKGGVWLQDGAAYEDFPLRLSLRFLNRFLRKQLRLIFEAPLKDVPWHLGYRCEWCEFYAHCRSEAEQRNSVSLLPGITVAGRNYLRDAPWAGGSPVETLSELKGLLLRDDIDTILDACGSLRGRGNRLLNAVEALETGQPVLHGGYSMTLPKGESVKIIMTLQDDPVSGEIYAAGFQRQKGRAVYGSGSSEPVTYVAENLKECGTIKEQFLKDLHVVMLAVQEYNTVHEERKSLQLYVFDTYELALFNRLLQEMSAQPDTAEIALQMVFYFQDPMLAERDEQPEDQVSFPVTVITRAINQLMAMPIPLSLRMPEVSRILQDPNRPFELHPRNLFWSELSNTMKAEAIFHAWSDGGIDYIDKIRNELCIRLYCANSVLESLRARVQDKLIAWPGPFRFPGKWDFKNPEFSKLAFVTRYECYTAALASRERRAQPKADRIRDGITIPIRRVDDSRWECLTQIDPVQISVGFGFTEYLLVETTDEGDKAQMRFDDTRFHNPWSSWGYGPLHQVAVTGFETNPQTGLVNYLTLNAPRNKNDSRSLPEEAWLQRRFTDMNTDRIIKRLSALDSRDSSICLDLIRDPKSFAREMNDSSYLVSSATSSAADRAGFTPSQFRAFAGGLLKRRSTLVWGPPGTGKTHFLAHAILCMIMSRREAGKPFRVGITAFTNSAINNVLHSVRRNLPRYAAVLKNEELPLYKVVYDP
ncbi:MAG: AAA domain-containing protein, partial [Pseudomonadota bacterium]